MKSVAFLAASVLLILTCAFTCKNCHHSPYAASFTAVANDSTLLFDSVVNASEGETVWVNPRTPWQEDSIDGLLNINPEKTETTFYFYSSQKVDTLNVEYEFVSFYDSSCDAYLFELEYGGVVSSSFSEMTFNNLNVEILLH